MKNLRFPSLLFIAALIMLASGCGVFSLHPLYHSEDLILVSGLTGIWKNENDENTVILIDTLENNKYSFTIVWHGDSMFFEMGLLKLNNQFFIDLFPDDRGTTCQSNDPLFSNYIPVHTFMKMDISENGFVLTEFDNDRLRTLFKQNRIRLAHEQLEGSDDIVITARTNDLQKFISRYAHDEKAFLEPDYYSKIK